MALARCQEPCYTQCGAMPLRRAVLCLVVVLGTVLDLQRTQIRVVLTVVASR